MGQLLSTALACGLWALSACSAGSPERQPHASGASQNSIRLTGRINAASLQLVERGLTPQTERLIINSAGGRGPEAIKLGSLIRSRDLMVVVDGICLSACAHFVFLPARSKRVEPNSVVAFHQTATAISDLLSASGRPDLASWFLPFADQEQDFYVKAGISRRALVEPFEKILPICYREDKSLPVSSEYRTATFTHFTFYVPTLADLYAHGSGQITGDWPSSPRDVERAISRYPKKLRATFKIKLPIGRDNERHQTRTIRTCPNKPAFKLPKRSS